MLNGIDPCIILSVLNVVGQIQTGNLYKKENDSKVNEVTLIIISSEIDGQILF